MYLDNLKDAQHPGWQLTTWQLKRALGLPEGKWPDSGIAQARLGNTIVYVLARNPKGTGRKHRAFAVCAYCEKHIPAGRLHQHLKACPGWTAAKETK